MADTKLSEIEKRKKELELELSRIQDDLDKSIDHVKEDVTSSLDPKNLIRKHPLPALGASVLLGFLIGSGGKSSSNRGKSDNLGTTAARELKKALMKRGVSLLLDYIDDKVKEMKDDI